MLEDSENNPNLEERKADSNEFPCVTGKRGDNSWISDEGGIIVDKGVINNKGD